jgi:hypothetical protein
LLLAVSVPQSDAAATAKKNSKCTLRGSKTLAADARGRVFEKDHADGAYIYGCLYRTGRRFAIGDNPHDDFLSIDALALASPFVAYGETTASTIGTYEIVERLDLRNGRIKDVTDSKREDPDPGIDQVVLTPRGAVAWIGYGNDYTDILKVEKLDAAGHALLDPGPGVENGSLAVTRSGRRLYWSNGGEPRSAVLR